MNTYSDSAFVPVAEAAYLADLTDRQLQRTMDEKILAAPLVTTVGGRRFAKLAIVLAKFYFGFERNLTADARREVIELITKQLKDRPDLLSLDGTDVREGWTIALPDVQVNLNTTIMAVQEKMNKLALAQRKIKQDVSTMGGAPVFEGTRVPIDAVLSMKKSGSDLVEIKQHYPGVTADHISAAEIFREVNPKRGRPSGDVRSSWVVISTKKIAKKK
ncbi:DUF433 domain-containing protein [Xanthomonas citri]|uniref:DUF433 domain-containing protein n=1 Tax=Xanthomonas citri TaxID=346 RepID=UPI000B5C82AB|nr:DUF433 domain-containing protein [Xanthomonas citri]ASL01145.1 hypothetical protein XcvCFBP7113P_12985 [Xanthomonas citri pv. vignicola]